MAWSRRVKTPVVCPAWAGSATFSLPVCGFALGQVSFQLRGGVDRAPWPDPPPPPKGAQLTVLINGPVN